MLFRSGNEHNFPVLDLYEDTVQLIARSQIGYTPALLVNYGGPAAENFFYTRESPYHDPKLRRFMPENVIARRTLRRPWFADEEFVFPQLAAQAAKIVHAGGRVGIGGRGQLQGFALRVAAGVVVVGHGGNVGARVGKERPGGTGPVSEPPRPT